MASLRYRLAEDTINRDDLRALAGWLRTNPWLTQKFLVPRFERAWARVIGVRYAVLVNSGSSANLLALHALLGSGRMRNKKVVVPAIGWATSVMPAIQLGCQPILCDANPATFGLSPQHLEEICEREEPSAVMLVHVLGVPANLGEIIVLRRRYGFHLIEDACGAHGSRYDGHPVGAFGDFATFSFYFGHHLSTIEGGVVVTDDFEFYERAVMARAHGWANDLPLPRQRELAAKYGIDPFNRRFAFYVDAFNLRSTDLNAFLGLRQLKRFRAVVRRRRANDALYRKRFAGAEAFRCQVNPRADISSISIAVLARDAEHRAKVGLALKRAGIETRPLGGGSMGRQPFWTERYGPTLLPNADYIHDRAFHLPNHHGLAAKDVNAICDTVLAVKP